MKVKVSGKYQVVIPKAARRKLRLPKGEYMSVTKITDRDITFSRATPSSASLMPYAGILGDAWGKKPVAGLRAQRDQEWE